MSTPLQLRRAIFVLVGAFLAVSFAAQSAEAVPDPEITGGTMAEHETVQDAWRLLLDTFPGPRHCVSNPMPEVVIRPSNHVGIYDFRIDTIILRSGGFRLADAVHEFAHHLDWQCGFSTEDEARLFATTDLASHLRDSGWKHRPIEIFAETVVKLVLGPDASSAGGRANGLHPGPEVQAFVARWGDEAIAAATHGGRGRFSLVPL